MAGGSLGAIIGSEISVRLSESYTNYGLELFALASSLLLFFAIIVATYLVNLNNSEVLIKKVGGNWSDAISNIISVKEVKSVALYSWLFTALMTVQWISAIPIIESYSDLSPERIVLFNRIEQLVSPLNFNNTIIFDISCYIFLWNLHDFNCLWLVFIVVFLLYGLAPSVGSSRFFSSITKSI